MAHDSNFPANDGFLADFPAGMREEIRAIVDDAIVNALKLNGLTAGNGAGQIPISNGVENTGLNAERIGGKFPSAFAPANYMPPAATGSSNGAMSNTDKTKLDNIAANAEVNQNAFTNVKVGEVTVQADSKTDTLELVPGENIAITPDAINDRIIIAVTGKVGSASRADAVSWSGVNDKPSTFNDYSTKLVSDLLTSICSGTYGPRIDMLPSTGTPNRYLRLGFADNSNNWLTGSIQFANSGYPTIEGNKIATINQIPSTLPADGGTSDYCRYPHRLYRGGSDGEGENNYYVAPSWRTGQGWELKSYNNSGDEQANIHRVIVGYADNAGSVPWDGISNKPTIPSATGTRVWTSMGFAPAANSYQYATHNLDLDPTLAKAELLARCTMANNGYSVGDVLSNPTLYYNANFPTVVSVGLTANTVYFTSAALYLYIKHKTSAAALALPFTAGWEVFFRIWY